MAGKHHIRARNIKMKSLLRKTSRLKKAMTTILKKVPEGANGAPRQILHAMTIALDLWKRAMMRLLKSRMMTVR